MTFALVDCESFYASCERIFRPDLRHKPIVVLSNNDGCIIARSTEAKAMGIPMGVPWFKVKDTYLKAGGVVFSSNYVFYGDISSRVMTILKGLVPELECYSIDEAFLGFSQLPTHCNLYDFGCHIRCTIGQWVGVPVRIGIAPTKTLTKVALYQIKKQHIASNVLQLKSDALEAALVNTPVGEVWGIGRRMKYHLNHMGIESAHDLAISNEKVMRNRFGVLLERTIRELNGQSCVGLDRSLREKKQIIVSRSLRRGMSNIEDIKVPLSNFVARASEKLRLERQQCKRITVFIRTNPFSKGAQGSFDMSESLSVSTNDTRQFIRIADSLLKKIFRPGYRYTKVGVMMDALCKESLRQGDLFEGTDNMQHELMCSLDAMNKQGANIFFGSQQGTFHYPRSQMQVSPRYTTSWHELPVVS
jgi:DNA polymerase V